MTVQVVHCTTVEGAIHIDDNVYNLYNGTWRPWVSKSKHLWLTLQLCNNNTGSKLYFHQHWDKEVRDFLVSCVGSCEGAGLESS